MPNAGINLNMMALCGAVEESVQPGEEITAYAVRDDDPAAPVLDEASAGRDLAEATV